MDNEAKETVENKLGIFQWILFAGIIPLMIGITLFLLVLEISGYNVVEHAKKLPIVASFYSKEEEKSPEAKLEKELKETKAKLEDSKANEKKKTAELEAKDKELQAALQDNKKLTEELQQIKDSNAINDALLKTYEMMTPDRAAEILIEIDQETAVKILSNLKEATLVEILENMPVNKAAVFTAKLAK
ncbi:hypothetical protein OEV98_00835 [Caldibacillus lycopersici]|uniref:Magnesium transporter MgtE intracellular domain-containing protein n=1 Tax=Perspicuibacillus lycopersici TaxID=1325689 RepID=A0AAE3LLW8_9BACI|nr:hypothetical protein [Perspicuibacillus lycopersici]MCU9612102.1 hypothetical protein [Perspicuibacillus lycopersici]